MENYPLNYRRFCLFLPRHAIDKLSQGKAGGRRLALYSYVDQVIIGSRFRRPLFQIRATAIVLHFSIAVGKSVPL
jgi:hypothetical protein